MFRAIGNAFKIPDLRNKILFTLAIIAIYRLGSVIPIPGIDYTALREVLDQAEAGGFTQLLNLFSGGALTQLAVFALGIMPYITASIIMQLLVVVIPKLEEWQKEGATGTAKITQITRYVTVVLAVLQSTALIVLIQSGQLYGGFTGAGGSLPPELIDRLMPDDSIAMRALMILTLTAGTAFIMWLGELITQRGIGNGMSILIFAAIIAAIPGTIAQIFQQNVWLGALFLLVGLVLIVGVVFVEQGQRRIPVQYAKRQVGRRMVGGQQTYIPLKVNQSGVIPIIFASSLLYLPTLASSIIGSEWLTSIVDRYFVTGAHPVYIATYFALTVFFAYFYTAITFNPIDVADNMKRYGGFIPGIRPGRPTAEYLDRVLTRITLPGSLYLASLAILPLVVLSVANIPFPLGGATLLIVVGVGLETMKQLESQLLQRHYEGFLRS